MFENSYVVRNAAAVCNCTGPMTQTCHTNNPEGHQVGCPRWGGKLREGDQQLPVLNDEPDIQSQVIADIEERRRVGIQRYGTALQAGNGRDAVRDLYEELIDGAMYAKQWLVERERLLARVAELEAERDNLRDELLSDVYQERGGS